MGAQVADHVGLRLLRGRGLRRHRSSPRGATSRCIPAARDAAYAQFLIGSSYFDQIPDVSRDQEPHREGDRRARRGGRANIRTPNTPSAPSRRSRSRATSSPARRCRSAATIMKQTRLHRRHQPLQGRGDAVPDHPPRRGGAAAADRGLYGARHRQRGADRRRRARPQLPGQPLVQGRLCAGEERRPEPPRTRVPGSARPSRRSARLRSRLPRHRASNGSHAHEPQRAGAAPAIDVYDRYRCAGLYARTSDGR